MYFFRSKFFNKGFTPLEKATRVRERNSLTGFTLIEVLVSGILITVIFSIIFATLWTGLKARERSRKIAQRYMSARVVLGFMSSEIREAFEFNYSNYRNFDWDQDNKKLSYWGVYSDGSVELKYPGLSPIARESFYVKQEDGKNIIYRSEIPIWPLEEIRVIEGPVMEGDFDLEVEYPVDAAHPDGDIEKLPVKVIIYITIDEEGQEKELIKSVYLPQYKRE